MKKIVEIAHQFMQDYMNEETIAVDFTLGQGYDSLFLSEHCKYVYSFDIQQEAIEYAKNVISNKNIEYILDSHEHADHYVSNYDVGIFNLGYFPLGDKNITTMLESTKIALSKALALLNKKGLLCLVLYVGHNEGLKESIYVENYLKTLDPHIYRTYTFKPLNIHNCPYIVLVEKIRSS